MNRTLAFVLACISLPVWSASPITFVAKPLGKHIQTLSNAFAWPRCLAQASHLNAATETIQRLRIPENSIKLRT